MEISSYSMEMLVSVYITAVNGMFVGLTASVDGKLYKCTFNKRVNVTQVDGNLSV